MNAMVKQLVIGWGSESGRAEGLARSLAQNEAFRAYSPRALPLNEIDLNKLSSDDMLVIISSSFGDGEPPANAEIFWEKARQLAPQALAGMSFATFGLGDTSYPRFCGFTKNLDALLQDKGATRLIQRVDSDACYAQFFAQWVTVLQQVLNGDLQAGQALKLQVQAYGVENAFSAHVLERRQINRSSPGAWLVRLGVQDSGMVWKAGDTLHLIAENDAGLLHAMAKWLDALQAVDALRHLELRQISKAFLREIVKLGGHEELKRLLKFSNKPELDAYLWGADVLDVLQDFCTPEQVTLDVLLELLSPMLPRAYSIASAGHADSIELCVREVQYERNGRKRHGAATRWLLGDTPAVKVYCRSNPGFHLPADTDSKLLMVGTGTGIAPLIGLMREMKFEDRRQPTILFFGEKRRDEDFLYEQELNALQSDGILNDIVTAFSRDEAEKRYVQHALLANPQHVQSLLQSGGHIYVCGNKRHLEKSVANVVDETAGMGAWQGLVSEGRVHQELY